MSLAKLPRATPLRATRTFATSAPRLSGLSATAQSKAEKISQEWKGTSATGGNTKNFVGGEFVESKAEKWIDVHDPVRNTLQQREGSQSPYPSRGRQRKLFLLGSQRPLHPSSNRQWMRRPMRSKLGVVRVS